MGQIPFQRDDPIDRLSERDILLQILEESRQLCRGHGLCADDGADGALQGLTHKSESVYAVQTPRSLVGDMAAANLHNSQNEQSSPSQKNQRMIGDMTEDEDEDEDDEFAKRMFGDLAGDVQDMHQAPDFCFSQMSNLSYAGSVAQV